MPQIAETDNQALSSQALPLGKGHRACLECRRKKTKCDMIQPVCGLCLRVGSSCTFPARRKQHVFRSSTQRGPQVSNKRRLDYLVNLLESSLKDGHGDLSLSLAPSEAEHDSESQRPAPLPASTTSREASEMDDLIRFQGYLEERPIITIQDTVPKAINASQTDNDISSGYSLELPKDLAEALIQLFFEKVQPWLPLLHKPRFMARFMPESANTLSRMGGYSLEEAMLFYGMFSLAARFSDHPDVHQLDPVERGIPFAETAHQLYDKARLAIEPSSLPYLQGCILLAFCMYTHGPSPRGWILTGVCVRMAYDLGLDKTDVGSKDGPSSVSQWVEEEGLRRAWWLVWELDRFGSTISKRPYAIDQRRMAVKLPISDAAWFSNTPIQSAMLRSKPAEAWKTLRDAENQDVRAWFLVANHLMACANDISHANEEVSEREMQELNESITCYALVLPRNFRLDNISFTRSNSAESNFIISIHFMLMSARNALSAYERRKCSFSSTNGALGLPCPYRDELPRIVSKWPPEYISLSHPFIACMMLPLDLGALLPSVSDYNLLEDLAILVLSVYAEHWQIGKTVLHTMEVLKRGALRNRHEMGLARAFALYFPSPLTKFTPSLASDPAQESPSEPKTRVSGRSTQDGGQSIMDSIHGNLQASGSAMGQSQQDPASVLCGFDGFSNIWSPTLECFPEDSNLDFNTFFSL